MKADIDDITSLRSFEPTPISFATNLVPFPDLFLNRSPSHPSSFLLFQPRTKLHFHHSTNSFFFESSSSEIHFYVAHGNRIDEPSNCDD
jgi:hypothetical protein